jgi:hypothetical protein
MSRIFYGAGKEHPTNSKENRDLLIFFLWGSDRYEKEEISKLFGLTYSAVSFGLAGHQDCLRH